MKRFRRSCAGTNLVEAAIITPLLLVLACAIADFSTTFSTYRALEGSATRAIRFALTGDTMTDPSSPSLQLARIETIKGAMRQATPAMTIPDWAMKSGEIPVKSGTYFFARYRGPYRSGVRTDPKPDATAEHRGTLLP